MEKSNNQTSIENFEPNVLAAFSYLIPPLTGIIFFLIEKKSKFIKFHALQSIFFGVLAYVLATLVSNLKILYIGYFLQPLVSFFIFGTWLFLMWKAYQYEEYELPYLGKIAHDQLDKPTQKPQA